MHNHLSKNLIARLAAVVTGSFVGALVAGITLGYDLGAPGAEPSLRNLLIAVGAMAFFGLGAVAVNFQRRRVSVEDALRDKDAYVGQIVDNAVDGLIAIDDHGLIVSFNPAAERIFGYEAAEVIGRNVSMLMPKPERDRHDKHLEIFRNTGKGRMIGAGPREVMAQRKSGSVFPIDLAISKVRLGGRRLVVGVARDISRRKETEKALREKQAWLQSIVDFSPNPIVIKDLEGRMQLVNREYERMHGVSARGMLGKTAADIYPEALAREIADEDAALMISGETIETEWRTLTPHGPRIFLEQRFLIRADDDPDSEPIAIGVIATDITHRVTTEAAPEREEDSGSIRAAG